MWTRLHFRQNAILGINDYTQYFCTTARSLRSGGIIDQQDLDWKFYRVGTSEFTIDKWEWHRSVVSAAETAGLATGAGSNAALLMKKAGLEVIASRTLNFHLCRRARHLTASLWVNTPNYFGRCWEPKALLASN